MILTSSTAPKRFALSFGLLTFGLWLICVFSLFVPTQVYVLLFASFIFCVTLLVVFRINAGLARPRGLALVFIGVTYIVWASLVFALNREFSVPKQYIKLVLNTSFFVASVVFFEQHRQHSIWMLRSLKHLLALLIALSAVQVTLNVALLNAWLWPFSGQISNSSAAYLIATPGVFFGGVEKNIWATKIAFVVILYISISWVERRVSLLSLVIIGLGLFCVLYTFGRTAQLATFIGLALFGLLIVLNSRQRLYRLFLFGLILLLTPFILQYLSSLLRFDWSLFDLSQDAQKDGFQGRLLLWMSFLRNPGDFNYLWGNGIQYGRYYFSEIVFLGNDNFHNVFLNHLVDFGALGLLLYIFMIATIFSRPVALSTRLLLLLPLLACASLQYVGYDNDIMVYLSASWIILQGSILSCPKRNCPTQIQAKAELSYRQI
ncbi:O-antigen ligase family protein [Meiothermus sp. CFH 77666]|uniref:O-antigen ligase family protein n=1 Tax=Meiothermus sp. CFH 77666 TaxID=2817942 RepID=UPI001AA00F39|nr:O-antigen ligase family protein [Meiothermus sp. CFH 77666]MBO1436372.1 O-antigen ligase family protein [Meiothermus sp. CFH 77666]